MSLLKKYQFWVCVVFSVVFFAAIYPLSVSSYTGAYYVLGFNALSIICFAFILYRVLTKTLTNKYISKLLLLLVITMIPHFLLAVLSYGSWVCLGTSFIMVIVLLFIKNRSKK